MDTFKILASLFFTTVGAFVGLWGEKVDTKVEGVVFMLIGIVLWLQHLADLVKK